MKKIALALLLAVVLVIGCGCSKIGGSTPAETPVSAEDTTGMIEYTDGSLSVWYPDTFVVYQQDQTVSGVKMLIQVVAPDNTNDNLNIICNPGNAAAIKAVTEDALKSQLESSFYSGYGASDVNLTVKNYTNTGDKIDLTYDADMTVGGQSYTLAFRQIMVTDGSNLYTITYTCNMFNGSAGIDAVFGKSADTIRVK